MKDKIVQLMKSEGLTPSRLAEILEIQPSGVSHLVSGRNKPGFDLLQKILRRFPRLNPYWLLLDDGSMYLHEESPAAVPPAQSPSTVAIETPNVGDLFSRTGVPSPQISQPQVDLTSPPTSSIIDQATPRLKRVIMLYDDGSCESYTIR